MKLSLAKLNFLNIFLTAIIFTTTIGIFITNLTTDNHQKKIKKLEEDYIASNKLLVKKEVERIRDRIVKYREELDFQANRALSEKVNFVSNLLTKDKTITSSKEFIKKYKNILDLYEWDNKTGYFYIFKEDGEIIYHINKEYLGKDIFQLTKDNRDLKNFIESSLKKNKNFGSYSWQKPTGDMKQLYRKNVLSKYHEPFKIYYVAGKYIDEMEKDLKSFIFNQLEKERFGEDSYGYFWLHDLNSIMRMHPYAKSAIDTKGSPELTKILDGMNQLVSKQEKGYYRYSWFLPGQEMIDEKISYIYLIKDWNLVLGSGFYLTELKDLLKEEKALLEEELDKNLKDILLILALLFALSIFIAIFISRKIKRVEDARVEELNMLNQYKLILDSSSVVSKADLAGTIIYVNDTFSKICGYSQEEAIGKNHNIVRHPQTPKAQFKKMWETIQSGKIWKGVIKNRKKNGESYFNSTTIVPIKDSHGDIIEYISAGSDITEMITNKDKLKNIFNTDSLTGLGNRFKLINLIGKNDNEILALIDIDRFREVNDLYGNKVGDGVIKTFAKRLFEYFNTEEYQLFRIQGDVLALYSKQKRKEEIIFDIENFIEAIGKEPYKQGNNSFILTYSVGVAEGKGELLAWADLALSDGKKKKKQIQIYDPSLIDTKDYEENMFWVNKLTSALHEDKIVPHFQPIFNYHTGKVEKYECLMRMQIGTEIISPFKFLEVAKRTKLYPELTYKMIEKSIDVFSQNSYEFSINLSVEDIMNNEIMTYLYNYAEKKGVMKRMVLEIVESEEMESYDEVVQNIKRFKESGAKIAIDDFGSGYSNYDYLISLQADYLKVDGSIVKHLVEDKRTRDVVKSIVTFAKKSNIKTIAEFVSSPELDEILREADIDYAQGYLYGKPSAKLLDEEHDFTI